MYDKEIGELFITEQDKPYPDSIKKTEQPKFPRLLKNTDKNKGYTTPYFEDVN